MKRYLVCFFLIINFCIFSANVNSDEARQKAVAEAQRWVDQKIPYQFDGVHDCSGLVLSAYRQAGLNYPKGSAFNGRQTQSMFNGIQNKISPGQEHLLKPGDAVFFTRGGSAQGGIGHTAIVASVNSPNCGGGVEVIETYQEKKNPRRKCLKDMRGYAGAISFDEIIRANGHTPVDSGGNVLPSIGSPIGGMGGDGNNYYDSGYMVDFDGVIKMFVDEFEKGIRNIGTTLVVIMTFVFIINFILKCIKERMLNLENVVIELAFDLLKFAFFLVLIRNYPAISAKALDLCFKVAEAFGSDLKNYKVLNQIMTSYIENIEFLIKEFSSESSNIFVKVIQNTMTMLNPLKMTIIMSSILYTTAIFAYIVFQITRVIMTYVISASIIVLLLPFWFSNFLQEYIPNPTTIFCKAVLQMFASIVFISISLRILDGVKMNSESAFDYLAVFTYIVYFSIVAGILRQILKRISQIV